MKFITLICVQKTLDLSDFTDMLRRLINCRFIVIVVITVYRVLEAFSLNATLIFTLIIIIIIIII